MPKTVSAPLKNENYLSDSKKNVSSLRCSDENVKQSKCTEESVSKLVCLENVNPSRYPDKNQNQQSSKENQYWHLNASVNQSTLSEESVHFQRQLGKNASSNYLEQGKNLLTFSKESINQQLYLEERANQEKCSEESIHQRYSENINLPSQPEGKVSLQLYANEDTKYSYHDEYSGSITEDDFYSLHSDTQNTNSCTLLNSSSRSCQSEFVSENDYQSYVSVSESSCYRSISSSISESLTFNKGNINSQFNSHSTKPKIEYSLEKQKPLLINPTDFEVSSKFSATLSYIIDPGNFWIQLESFHGPKLSFPK